MRKVLVVAATIAATVGLWAAPAAAGNDVPTTRPAVSRVTDDPEPLYINETVSGSHDTWLQNAASFVDSKTRTRLVWGACLSQYRCTMVRQGRLDPCTAGQTTPCCERPSATWGCEGHGYTACVDSPAGRLWCTITMDIRTPASSRPAGYWPRLYEHELGHTYGLKHNTSATNIMYAPISYKDSSGTSRTVPEVFTATDLVELARW